MKKLLLSICCLFCLAGAYSQQPAPSTLLTRFKFIQLTGGIILMQGKLEPFPDTLNFILDTGSGGISLDSLTTEYFGLKGTPSNLTIKGIAGIRQVSFLYNRKLQLPGLTVDSLNFHINDYSILSSVYGEKIDGIIGYSLFSRYIIKINYDSSRMEIWTKGTMKYPRRGHLLKPIINTLPVQELTVRDEKIKTSRFLLDMGAGLNLMLSSEFIRDSALLMKKRKFFTKEAEGLGGKIDISLTVMKELKLGPYRFKKVPIYVFDDVNNVTAYPYLGGLIGNDILRRFNVVINYEKKEFHLSPNSHYKDAFDYSYSGIELYYYDGFIMLGDVAKNSPAEKAGLKEGDVVVAINNNFNQNLQVYKAALQNAGDRLKIVIQRDGDLMQFEVKVQNILK